MVRVKRGLLLSVTRPTRGLQGARGAYQSEEARGVGPEIVDGRFEKEGKRSPEGAEGRKHHGPHQGCLSQDPLVPEEPP